MRLSLHHELKRGVLPSAQEWVTRVTAHDSARRVLDSVVFQVSNRRGARRVLNQPVEWELLWSVSADEPVGFWILEHDDLSIEEEHQFVRATLLRETYCPSKRDLVELTTRYPFLAKSKRERAKVLGLSESALYYYLPKPPATAEGSRVDQGSHPGNAPQEAIHDDRGVGVMHQPEPDLIQIAAQSTDDHRTDLHRSTRLRDRARKRQTKEPLTGQEWLPFPEW